MPFIDDDNSTKQSQATEQHSRVTDFTRRNGDLLDEVEHRQLMEFFQRGPRPLSQFAVSKLVQ